MAIFGSFTLIVAKFEGSFSGAVSRRLSRLELPQSLIKRLCRLTLNVSSALTIQSPSGEFQASAVEKSGV